MPPSPLVKLKKLGKKKKDKDPTLDPMHRDFYSPSEEYTALYNSYRLADDPIRVPQAPSPGAQKPVFQSPVIRRPAVQKPRVKDDDDDDDNEVAVDSESDNEGLPLQRRKTSVVRSSPSTPTTPTAGLGNQFRPAYYKAMRSRECLDSTGSASPSPLNVSTTDLSRQVSLGLPPIAERPVTPTPTRPLYIHRKQTRHGTKWSLRAQSPSGGTLNSGISESGSARTPDRTWGILVAASKLQDIIERDSGERSQDTEHPFRQPVAPSGSESPEVLYRKGKLVSSDVDRPLPKPTTPEVPGPWARHKRSKGSTLTGNEDESVNPNDPVKAGMSFASSRHTPPEAQSSSRRKACQKTTKRDASPASSTHGTIPIAPPPGAAATAFRSSSPARASFEPSAYTPAEIHVYEQLRLAFSHAAIFERAGAMLNSLYSDPNWPAEIPRLLPSQSDSSIKWAREAAKELRSEARKHPVFKKCQANGNDASFRARNDLEQTFGDMTEIRERVENWEKVDKADGMEGEIKLVNGDTDEGGAEKPDDSGDERVSLSLGAGG